MNSSGGTTCFHPFQRFSSPQNYSLWKFLFVVKIWWFLFFDLDDLIDQICSQIILESFRILWPDQSWPNQVLILVSSVTTYTPNLTLIHTCSTLKNLVESLKYKIQKSFQNWILKNLFFRGSNIGTWEAWPIYRYSTDE